MSMTEQDAIKSMRNLDDLISITESEHESVRLAIKALEEIQQYRAIGTVEELEWCKDASHWKELFKEKLEQYEAIGTIEEFKALKEKQIPKKVFQPFGTHSYKCSSCWKFVAHEVDDNYDLSNMAEWCPYCGQKLDWREVGRR